MLSVVMKVEVVELVTTARMETLVIMEQIGEENENE